LGKGKETMKEKLPSERSSFSGSSVSVATVTRLET
jgi:hypothetical protein